jgi:hypothetical protein
MFQTPKRFFLIFVIARFPSLKTVASLIFMPLARSRFPMSRHERIGPTGS